MKVNAKISVVCPPVLFTLCANAAGDLFTRGLPEGSTGARQRAGRPDTPRLQPRHAWSDELMYHAAAARTTVLRQHPGGALSQPGPAWIPQVDTTGAIQRNRQSLTLEGLPV